MSDAKKKELTVQAMRSAARKGVDPYNSHHMFAKQFLRMWRDWARRHEEIEHE